MVDDGSDAPRDSSNEPRIGDDGSEFASLTGDFYRGELERTASWRGRLDQTTNWAVVVVAAILTWAFSSSDNPQYVILIGMFGVTAFLLMEANRYREYDVWRNRVRILQNGLFGALFAPGSSPKSDWQARLSDDLRDPVFHLSFREAVTHRLRRSYLGLLLLLLAAWLTRITVFNPSTTWREEASIYVIPGELVVGVIAVFYSVLVVIAVWSARGHRIREFQE